MKLMIRCPQCASVRAANPAVMGREIRCPACDHLFRVEPAMEIAAEQPLNAAPGKLEEEPVFEVVEVEPVQVERAHFESGQVQRANTQRPVATIEEDLPEEVSFEAKELPKDDMDMTPMVDVTFLLLIFFMITASFSSEKVFEKPPPMSETPSTKPPDNPPEVYDSVRVQIDEFNAYTIIFPTGEEREASSKQDLLMALGDAKNEVATGKDDEILKLIVEAHEECIHASIVAALDAGREKGFTSFTVSVVEEFE
ncbi:MAG: biopolymer transporter ExbD [Planctomycetes bacterium]|nr:biopolymer transporter ExbD [Planctomycetota bacterium]